MSLSDLRLGENKMTLPEAVSFPDRDADFLEYMKYLHEIIPEPLTHAGTTRRSTKQFSNGVKLNIWTKDLHEILIRSFKGAGAFLAMLKAKEVGKTEVVGASAGNHAQGMAAAAKALEMPATIYMPKGTDPTKVESTREKGGNWVEIVLDGNDFDEANALAKEHLDSSETAVPIPPYDDHDVIDGQGVHIFETFDLFKRYKRQVDMVLMGVGGGGFFAGSMQVRNKISPNTILVGAEQVGAECAKAALDRNDKTPLPGNPYGPGTNVKVIGEKNFEIIRELKSENDLLEVIKNREIAEAGEDFSGETIENSGLLGAAALRSWRVKRQVIEIVHLARLEGRDEVNLVAMLSGGNISAPGLARRKKDAEISLGKRAYIQVEIPKNKPGNLKNLARIIRDHDVNIINFQYASHRKISENGGQVVNLGLRQSDPQQIQNLIEALSAQYKWNDTNSEMTPDIAHELPESRKDFALELATDEPAFTQFGISLRQGPGSLLRLLQVIPEAANIEYFEYKEENPEDPEGEVKIGFSGPEKSIKAVREILKETDPKVSKPERVQALQY